MSARFVSAFAATGFVVMAGCSSQSGPVAVTPSDTCANCRMAVSNPRFAAQVAVPREEPVFYDDIGCLARALSGGTTAFAYVADHRTGEWVRAAEAAYTRVPTIATPMGSHIIAHANAESRRQDPAAAGGIAMTAADVFERGTGHGR